MSVPANYNIALYVAGVNIIQYCPLDKMELDDLAHDVSTFNFKIENAGGLTIEQNAEVLVFSMASPVTLIFTGYIMKLRQSKRDNGITIEYEVDCEDRKVRLQKSVIPYKNYQGLDSDILSDLLTDAYPDLSDVYDFSDLVNSFADNLNLNTNDDNLLDKIKELAEQANASYRFERNNGGSALITFDSGGWGSEVGISLPSAGWNVSPGNFITGAIEAVGNPDNCVRFQDPPSASSITSGNTIAQLRISLGGVFHVESISFDYYVDTADIDIVAPATAEHHTPSSLGVWQSHTFTIDANTQFPHLTFAATANLNLSIINFDIRLDNIRVNTTTPIPEGDAPKEKLVWDTEPDLTDFDFDIDLSDEYGHNFNLDIGGFDDFNSIIVTGGNVEQEISWTYHGNNIEDHFDLELPIKDIAVFYNTDDDVTPDWLALILGEWGVDKLFMEGGDKDVLYDSKNHWLYFDSLSIPADLQKAIKVEGKILRPIRVKVENVTGDEPIYATTLYDENITTEEQAAQAGFAELEKRKALRQLSFTTYEPLLKVGQQISVTDSARGLSESLMIQRILVNWIGGKNAKFEVECGNEEAGDSSSMIANNDKRSRKKAAPSAIGTTSFEALTNDAGETLTNDLGETLYIEV